MSESNSLVARLFYLAKNGAVYVDNPSLGDVMNALVTLDGHDTDTFQVWLSNGDTMDVGGGAEDKYKCHARTKNSFYDLVDPQIPKVMADTMDIQMGDETNTFPRCSIVSREMVKIAVECFCVTGELSSRLHWDNTLEYEPL